MKKLKVKMRYLVIGVLLLCAITVFFQWLMFGHRLLDSDVKFFRELGMYALELRIERGKADADVLIEALEAMDYESTQELIVEAHEYLPPDQQAKLIQAVEKMFLESPTADIATYIAFDWSEFFSFEYLEEAIVSPRSHVRAVTRIVVDTRNDLSDAQKLALLSKAFTAALESKDSERIASVVSDAVYSLGDSFTDKHAAEIMAFANSDDEELAYALDVAFPGLTEELTTQPAP